MIFILGLLIGSFLNVVIYRLPKKESIVFPASHCTSCGTRLKAWDLVPIFSFLFAKGKCRYCGEKISWQYPAVELLTALLYTLLYLKLGFTIQFLSYIILITLMIICSFIDFKHFIIPNKITYSGIIIGLIFAIFLDHITFVQALLGILIPAGFLFLIALIYKKGMGLGDVKYVAMIGSFLGWADTLLAIFFGALLGSIFGIIFILAAKTEKKSKIPFGPYLSLGTLLVIFYGKQIISWYVMTFF